MHALCFFCSSRWHKANNHLYVCFEIYATAKCTTKQKFCFVSVACRWRMRCFRAQHSRNLCTVDLSVGPFFSGELCRFHGSLWIFLCFSFYPLSVARMIDRPITNQSTGNVRFGPFTRKKLLEQFKNFPCWCEKKKLGVNSPVQWVTSHTTFWEMFENRTTCSKNLVLVALEKPNFAANCEHMNTAQCEMHFPRPTTNLPRQFYLSCQMQCHQWIFSTGVNI